MAVSVSVTVVRVNEDGGTVPLDPEAAALLAGPVEQFSSLIGGAVCDAAQVDHGDREKVIETDGRRLQQTLLEATFALDTARE